MNKNNVTINEIATGLAFLPEILSSKIVEKIENESDARLTLNRKDFFDFIEAETARFCSKELNQNIRTFKNRGNNSFEEKIIKGYLIKEGSSEEHLNDVGYPINDVKFKSIYTGALELVNKYFNEEEPYYDTDFYNAQLNQKADEKLFNETIDKLLVLQTERERNIFKAWIWETARTFHGLRVTGMMPRIYSGQGAGKSYFLWELKNAYMQREELINAVPSECSIKDFVGQHQDPSIVLDPLPLFAEASNLDADEKDTLKRMVTGSTISVNIKYGAKYTQTVRKGLILSLNEANNFLSNDIGDRRYPAIHFKSLKGLYSLRDIYDMCKTLWQTVPFEDEHFIDINSLLSENISESSTEKMYETLAEMDGITANVDGTKILTNLDMLKKYLDERELNKTKLMQLVGISTASKICSKTWCDKMLASGIYFVKNSPTSKKYHGTLEFEKIYEAVKNGVDVDNTPVEDKSELEILKERNMELLAEVERLKKLLAERPDPDDPKTTKTFEEECMDFIEAESIERRPNLKDAFAPADFLKENNLFTKVEKTSFLGKKPSAQFLCLSSPSNEYKIECMDNGTGMQHGSDPDKFTPVFMNFESDTMSKEEQKAIMMDKAQQFDCIEAITDSGNKSIHALVRIRKDQANDVAKYFKQCWKYAAEKLFAGMQLDEANAGNGRLARMPNGVRDNGNTQELLFWTNKTEGFDFSEAIKEAKIEEEVKKCSKTAINGSYSVPDTLDGQISVLEKIASNKEDNEQWDLIMRLVKDETVESGENMISALGKLKAMGFDLALEEAVNNAHNQHPSNITANTVRKMLEK